MSKESSNKRQAKEVETEQLVAVSVGARVELCGVGTLVVARSWDGRGASPAHFPLIRRLWCDPLWSPCSAFLAPYHLCTNCQERGRHPVQYRANRGVLPDVPEL